MAKINSEINRIGRMCRMKTPEQALVFIL